MASIDVGSGNKRDLNRELPLIPFIDFLLCLVSFLLITAVWSQLARMEATARVPGPDTGTPPADVKTLHVRVSERRFDLEWREGSTLLATSSVERKATTSGAGDPTFPELAERVATEWRTNGLHRSASDEKRDRAVLHAPNGTSFRDLVAVMDALAAPKRALAVGGTQSEQPVFSVAFALD